MSSSPAREFQDASSSSSALPEEPQATKSVTAASTDEAMSDPVPQFSTSSVDSNLGHAEELAADEGQEGVQAGAETEAEVEGSESLTATTTTAKAGSKGEKAKKKTGAAKPANATSTKASKGTTKAKGAAAPAAAKKRGPKPKVVAEAAEQGGEGDATADEAAEAAPEGAAVETTKKKGKALNSGPAKGKGKGTGAAGAAAAAKKSKGSTTAASEAPEAAGSTSMVGVGEMSMMSTMSLPSTSAPGQSVFPLARVARIVKADKDVEMTSKDAIYVIAKATEVFIKHLTDSAYTKARLDKKRTITYKELASAVHTQPEFFFLPEVIPQPITLSKALAKRKEMADRAYMREAGLLDEEEEQEGGGEGETQGPEEDGEEKEGEEEVMDDDEEEEEEGDVPDLEDGPVTAPKKQSNGSRKRQSDVQEVCGDGIIMGVDQDGDTPMDGDEPISPNGASYEMDE